MVKLKICELDSKRVHQIRELDDGVFTIGRTNDNNIVLNNPTVSGKHALIRVDGNKVSVTDLGSTNYTYIAGESIPPNKETSIPLSYPVMIGLFELIFTDNIHDAEIEKQSNTQYRQLSKNEELVDNFKAMIQSKLFERLDLIRLEAQNINKEELGKRASKTVVEIVNEMANQIPAGKTKEQITKEILSSP